MNNQMNQIRPPAGYRLFAAVAALFVSTLVLSNLAATKLIPVGPFVFSAGILLFPVTYIFGDCLTEVYGYRKTRQVIWIGFAANIFMAVFFSILVAIPPAKNWPLQESFSQIFGQVPRIVLASVCAYWIGEFSNSFVLAKLKVATKGKHLWLRTIGSTFVGQGLDTLVFILIAWGGILDSSLIFQKIWSGYFAKVAYEVAATPITYLVVSWLKRVEEVDVFDENTNFTPFSIKV
jgi:uncharacterized integral membrane protein (TIGR00697 family)